MSDSTQAEMGYAARLGWIADALGVSAESFTVKAPSSPLGNLSEVPPAYAAIGDAQDRRRVLSVARAEAARCCGKAGPRDVLPKGTVP